MHVYGLFKLLIITYAFLTLTINIIIVIMAISISISLLLLNYHLTKSFYHSYLLPCVLISSFSKLSWDLCYLFVSTSSKIYFWDPEKDKNRVIRYCLDNTYGKTQLSLCLKFAVPKWSGGYTTKCQRYYLTNRNANWVRKLCMIMQQILMMGRIRFGILNLTAVTTFLISPSLIEIYMFGGVSPLLQRVATAKRKH